MGEADSSAPAGKKALGSIDGPIPIELHEMFHDLERVHQDDGPNPVCAIDYRPDFIECMDYLRAVMHKNELSERSLKLTTICLRHNPANYTTWHFRRQCMAALTDHECGKYEQSMVQLDLKFAAELGGSNPKNYQIWYHRRALLEPTLTPEDFEAAEQTESDGGLEDATRMAKAEIEYINGVLEEDAKNYHAWSHRQWIARCLDNDELWTEEEEFAHKLLLEDIRNNSAWNHRWFAVHRGELLPLSGEIARKEAAFGMDCVKEDPFNESSWRYLIGVINEQMRSAAKVKVGKGETSERSDGSENEAVNKVQDAVLLVNQYEDMAADLEVVMERSDDPKLKGGCPALLSARVDLLEAKGDVSSLSKAVGIARVLSELDKIRMKYWLLREKELRVKFDSLSN